MEASESTCWTAIRAAAAGGAAERDAFARRHEPVVRAYLTSRWRSSPSRRDLDDAVQEVFVECFKPDGVLDRAEPGRDFRPFLYGVVRNVALRVERERGRSPGAVPDAGLLDNIPDREQSLSHVFDRAWAEALLREAARLMEDKATADGGRDRVPDLNGTWYMNGDEVLPCSIRQRPNGRAVFTNENGDSAQGEVRGDRVSIPDWSPGEGVQGLEGRIRGDRIVWPDGHYWSRWAR